METNDDPEQSAKARLTVLDQGHNIHPTREKMKMTHQLLPWLIELGSLILSLACAIAVIVLLVSYDGKAIPSWHGVTFNALISVLAHVALSALALPNNESAAQLKWP